MQIWDKPACAGTGNFIRGGCNLSQIYFFSDLETKHILGSPRNVSDVKRS